ncbi:MAG: DJ-1/PfpI family protein [Verrucomicrobiota bacterium]
MDPNHNESASSEHSLNRRTFIGTTSVSAAAVLVGTQSAAADQSTLQKAGIKVPPLHQGRKPEVAMLLHPGVTLLDLLGPHTVLATACNVHLVWKNTDLLETDTGIIMKATTTFGDCPEDIDVLFAPGGDPSIMRDEEVLRFLADRGSRAKWVTSVCGGSILLGAAGLMQGYKATSHWSARDALALFGATPVEARVVTDRNRISGGGVTAGIDFGLVLLAELLGEDIAKMTQLALEYDPAPPFDTGTPKKAGTAIVARLQERFGPMEEIIAPLCTAAAKDMHKYTPSTE